MVLPRLTPGVGTLSATKTDERQPPPTIGPGGELSPGGNEGDDETDDGDETVDDDGPDETDERTIEQLRNDGDPNTVDRTPVLESGDIPVRTDEWPLGFPIQGVPRVASVLSLQYVYDETRDEWRRLKASDLGGGSATVTQDVEILQQTDMAGQDTIDIGGILSSDYDVYEVVMSYVTIGSTQDLVVQMRQASASSYDTNTANYEAEDDGEEPIGAELESLIDAESVVRLTIYDPLDGSVPTEVEGRVVNSNASTDEDAAARYLPDAAVDGIRFRGSDNGSLVNFTNGVLRVYGKRGL